MWIPPKYKIRALPVHQLTQCSVPKYYIKLVQSLKRQQLHYQTCHLTTGNQMICRTHIHTLKIAGMMPISVLRKLILSGRVFEGKYEQVRTCTPHTSRLGLSGRHVGASSNEWCNCSKSRVRTFSRRDSLLAFTFAAISYIFCNINENRRKKFNYQECGEVKKQ
jgi:hypothetical protein